MAGNTAERIQKVLANAGYGSRRTVEDWLRQGRIRVNGKAASLGDRITAREKITLDGKLLKLRKTSGFEIKIIGYNKPPGEVCSRRDEKGRTTVFENLPKLKQGRWINVGRLDINTSGLMIFTNNGTLANRLMHPSTEVEREYAVRVLGRVSDEKLEKLLNGVILDDGPASFTGIIDKGDTGANHWYNVTINEGRNREVKRLWESQGVTVSRLKRIRFGPCLLPRGKKPGTWWKLSTREYTQLLQTAGLLDAGKNDDAKSQRKKGKKDKRTQSRQEPARSYRRR